MKFKFGLILVFIVILGTLTTGCVEIGGNKTTGGGWFIDEETENIITFGFNVQHVGDLYLADIDGDLVEEEVRDVKGQFQLIDHADKTRVHGTFQYGAPDLEYNEVSAFAGVCFVDKDGPHLFGVGLTVEPEESSIYLWIDMNDNLTDDLDPTVDKYYIGDLEGGSIKIHAK